MSYYEQVVTMIRNQIEEFESVATFGDMTAEQVERNSAADGEEEQPDCRVLLNVRFSLSLPHGVR